MKGDRVVIRSFTLEYWMDDGKYTGRLKEIPTVFGQGETLAELESAILATYRLMLDRAALKMTLDVCTKEISVEV
jgi:predicted RNase H-like HicB family nuclease